MEPILLVFLGVIILLGLIMLAVPKFTPGAKREQIDKEFVKNKWQEIASTAEQNGQSARFAVVEADKLLDYALKKRGYRGETMGDRMRSAGSDFSYRNDVWEAHKLRNKLVHEAQYEVDQRIVKRAVDQFKQALRDLGAM